MLFHTSDQLIKAFIDDVNQLNEAQQQDFINQILTLARHASNYCEQFNQITSITAFRKALNEFQYTTIKNNSRLTFFSRIPSEGRVFPWEPSEQEQKYMDRYFLSPVQNK